MSLRFAAFGVCVGLTLLTVRPVEAQLRLFRGRPNDGLPVNPIHEQMKRDVEQAYQQGQYQRAVDLATRVLTQNPRDHVAYYLRGSARVELGRNNNDAKLLREGISDARQAIALAGTSTVDYFLPYLYGMTNLAAVESRNQHAEVAVEVAGQTIARPGVQAQQRANLLFQRAMAHLQLRDFDAAIADYEQAVRSQPTHLGAHIGLADAYVAAGEHPQALEAFGKAVDAFPSEPLVYNNRGMYLQQRGKLADSLLDFTRALEIDDEYFYAYTNRGYSLMQMGDAESAASDFTASLRINERQPTVYSLRAAAWLDQGQAAKAIADYARAVEMAPGDAAAYGELGFAKFFAKDYTGALAAFDQALARDSKLAYVHPWQYLAMESTGRRDEAQMKFAERIKKEAKRRTWVDNLLGYLAGNLSEEDLLAAVNSSDPKTRDAQHCEAHFFIGQRQERAGNGEQAAKHFRMALQSKATHLSAYRGARFALKEFNVADTDAKADDGGR